MILTEIEYSSAQARFIKELDKIGAVLETVILKPSVLTTNLYSLAKAAAITGMEILAERHRKWFEQTNSELKIEDYFNIEIFPNEELSGDNIDFGEFIGNGYALEADTLNLFTYNYNDKFISQNTEKGFAKALLNPPYSLHIDKVGEFASNVYAEHETKSLTQVLKKYLTLMLKVNNIDDTKYLTIIQWSNNWSNYFESGKEWWGAFCWTIYDSRDNTIAFIAAASTD